MFESGLRGWEAQGLCVGSETSFGWLTSLPEPQFPLPSKADSDSSHVGPVWTDGSGICRGRSALLGTLCSEKADTVTNNLWSIVAAGAGLWRCTVWVSFPAWLRAGCEPGFSHLRNGGDVNTTCCKDQVRSLM